MKARDILSQVKHRPFDHPTRPWKFYQEWNKALFFHWEVDPILIQELLPKGIELDIINGKTWISLVAFNMNHVGVRSILKIPHISDFHEINIRIYVRFNNKPGVYFLSMEGSKRSSCRVLKTLSRFPYEYAEMKRTETNYMSFNRKQDNYFNTTYKIENPPIIKDEIDVWLTERYAVFQDYKKSIITYDVHHLEWPLYNLNIDELEINYPKLNFLLKDSPTRVHYSPGVKVLTWSKKRHRI
ncbi:YqjF family protein [Geojedonia litorea]|uniref:YqjF family protein n=1 Tax=Geojedonia litorea TaxID=1268269 RepID=A0ABV9N5X4_9FLAO